MDYAILDIETTGGEFNKEGIIEIAVYRFDGEKITDTFISLVNPEREIQEFVQKLTGITPKMVRTAPKFYELAKRLIEITEGATIVAHNVDFDYRVIKTEYSRLGFDFQRPVLDTIPLSKELIPDMPSYSLGKLCESLGIPLNDRHRAHGDARATVKLFQLLLAKDLNKKIIQSSERQVKTLSTNKKILRLLEGLPTQAGVFYLQNEEGKVLYIGSGSNISVQATRILTDKSKKYEKLQYDVADITSEFTGSEIIASIKEEGETVVNKPKYKSKRVRRKDSWGLFVQKNIEENLEIKIEAIRKTNKDEVLLSFTSIKKALAYADGLKEYKDKQLNAFIEGMMFENETILLIDAGRSRGEESFLLLENGVLTGYGFYTLYSQIKDKERVKKIMTKVTSADSEIYLQIRNRLYISERLKKMLLTE